MATRPNNQRAKPSCPSRAYRSHQRLPYHRPQCCTIYCRCLHRRRRDTRVPARPAAVVVVPAGRTHRRTMAADGRRRLRSTRHQRWKIKTRRPRPRCQPLEEIAPHARRGRCTRRAGARRRRTDRRRRLLRRRKRQRKRNQRLSRAAVPVRRRSAFDPTRRWTSSQTPTCRMFRRRSQQLQQLLDINQRVLRAVRPRRRRSWTRAGPDVVRRNVQYPITGPSLFTAAPRML